MATTVEGRPTRDGAVTPASEPVRTTPGMKKKQRQDALCGAGLPGAAAGRVAGLHARPADLRVRPGVLQLGRLRHADVRRVRQLHRCASGPADRQSWINTVWFTVLQVPGLMISGFLFAFLLQKAGRIKSRLPGVLLRPAGHVEHRRRGHLAVAAQPGDQPAQQLPGPDRASRRRTGCRTRRRPSRPSRSCRSGRAWATRS